MKKRLIGVLLALLIVASLATGCAKQAASTDAAAPAGAKDGAGIKVAVVANQKFGDNGPMDNLKAGVESMVEKHGIEAKYLESSAETFEEDVRAMAKANTKPETTASSVRLKPSAAREPNITLNLLVMILKCLPPLKMMRLRPF